MVRHRCRPPTAAPGRVSLAPPACTCEHRVATSLRSRSSPARSSAERLGVSDMADTVLVCMSRCLAFPAAWPTSWDPASPEAGDFVEGGGIVQHPGADLGGPVHPMRVMSALSASVRLSVVADAGRLGRKDLSMSTTAPRSTRRLTDAQLEEMLALTSHADSVELKLTVPDSERRSTVASLGMDPPGRPDPPGVRLRHPGPAPQQERRGRAGPPGPGPRRRHRGQAPADRPRRAGPAGVGGASHRGGEMSRGRREGHHDEARALRWQ